VKRRQRASPQKRDHPEVNTSRTRLDPNQLHHNVMVSANTSLLYASTNRIQAPNRAADKQEKKKGGRPSGSRNSNAGHKPAPKPKQSAAKKGRPRKQPAQEEPEDELSITEPAPTQASKSRKRKADAIAETEPTSRKQYVQLETRTKRISQEQIDAWPQVSTQVLEQITTVIRNAKKDIAETQRDERRIMAAHNTLNPLVRKLARQLAASRIPPQAKDIHFNIDKLTERNAQVSREVTTARHSKQLLTEQVQVAEHLLKKDEESLEELKKNAKKWRTEWKHQKKHGRVGDSLFSDLLGR
jgi:hypothetical protein